MPYVPEEAHQEHFGTPERQKEAATLGIWVFLATELLIFSGLFVGYGEYRYLYNDAFHAAGEHVLHWLGLVLTIVLASSSFVASLTVRAARRGRVLSAIAWLLVAMALGVLFMVLHLWEWYHHAKEGALPGELYHFEKATMPGASVFFTLYYLLTGLHMLHVTVGLGLLSFGLLRLVQGRISAEYSTPVEVVVLYWHFVDVIWQFLFPLFYLVRS